MPLIELSGIERVFHLGDTEVHALSKLDLTIETGEYVAIMGQSGSGKSTLLN
jgi:putative ABC transport system ATP-binding protein